MAAIWNSLNMSEGNAVFSGGSRCPCGQIFHVLDNEYEYLEMLDAAKRNIREIFVVEQHAGDYRRLRRPPLGSIRAKQRIVHFKKIALR